MQWSDWSSDVCSSDLPPLDRGRVIAEPRWPPLDREKEELSREPWTRPETPAGNEEPAARISPHEVLDGGASPPEETEGGTLPGAAPGIGQDTETGADAPEDFLPGGYVSRALEEYNAGRIVQALAVMDRFLMRFPAGTDEAWWLMGQLLEANSPARDIALALEYYRRLVREFPQSQRVPAAQRRIAYLERYYFNIK
jgi:TolA-binding protein